MSSITLGAPWGWDRTTLPFYHLPIRRRTYAVESEDRARQVDNLILSLIGHIEYLED